MAHRPQPLWAVDQPEAGRIGKTRLHRLIKRGPARAAVCQHRDLRPEDRRAQIVHPPGYIRNIQPQIAECLWARGGTVAGIQHVTA